MRTKIFTFIDSLIVPSLFVAVGLFAWHAAVTWFGVPAFVLPSLRDILIELGAHPLLYAENARVTLTTALMGYIVAIAVGVGLAGAFVWSRTLERGLYPYVLTIKITPTIAFAPLLVLWLGIGMASKIVTVVLICFFPIFIGALKGLKSADTDAVNLFRSLGATKWQTLRYLRLPSALPYLFPALKVSVLLALTGALVGEFVASNKGIGYMALYGLKTYESTVTFASVLTLILCGYVLFWLMSSAERRFVFWHRQNDL